jgi:hypothetical protein
MKTYIEFWAMWLSDLAKWINDAPWKTTEDQYNLSLAAKIWKERTGNWPTIGEIRVFIVCF